MNKLLLSVILGSAFLLSACQDQMSALEEPPTEVMQSGFMDQRSDGFRSEAKAREVNSNNSEADARMLAYIYRFTFALPAKNLEAVSAKALEDCRVAGTKKCQIVTSSINTYSEDNVQAEIKLRVNPDWFAEYRSGLLASNDAAGGKVLNSTTSAEDLTIQISDSGAKLKALQTLRERLLNLLEKRDSTVKDLIEIERELARVQGQIEGITARLRVLKTRVSMSEVYLDYQSKSVAASRSKFAAIGRALNDFIETVSGGIASVIYFIAFTLPWLIFGLPILWLIGKWWRKRKKRAA